jgi:sec-independent protein translocase protein TatB
MSFSDTVFIFFLALIVFGPKKLPEMARQAGRLLAELRRASNEFKSQIETEIAHLEVQKREEHRTEEQKKQPEFALAPASSANVASLSVNPAVGETIPHNTESTATLAAPEATSPAPEAVPPASSVSSSAESVEPSDSNSQASHV